MNDTVNAQPALDKGTLKLFSNATFDLLQDPAHPDLDGHLARLASLTQSDLVLFYEARPGADPFSLVAAHGLPQRLQDRFSVLLADESIGAGGWHQPASPSREAASSGQLTPDLQAMGMKAYWSCAVRLGGDDVGRLCFGSRRWQNFHKDAMAVFAATGTQLAWVIAERRGYTFPGRPAAPQPPKTADPTLATEPTERRERTEPGLADRNHFIAVLAHELRNPIAPIRSGMDLLSTDKVSDPVRRETLAMMQRQLAHLVRLMDDLLDTARLSSGLLPVQREPVRLHDVMAAAIESIQPALRAKQQALELVAPAHDLVVVADPVRLTQAFVNILNSNVKETPVRGTISVGATRRNEQVALTFADQGEGIDAQQAHNVFILFPPDKANHPDSGLSVGLALVKGLIELNGGAVDVKNRDRVPGSVFTVTLPLSDQPARTATTLGAQSPSTDWSSDRLLIVDDNRDAAEVLGLLFELDGKTIRLAHDGPAAVAAAAEFQPQIILMDMGLPGFNGLEAVRQIRQAPSEVRPAIVALTGWGAEADRQASREAGVDLHLVKPVTHQELSAALSSLTAGRGTAAAPVAGPTPGPVPGRDAVREDCE